jgi:hypothetical protein
MEQKREAAAVVSDIRTLQGEAWAEKHLSVITK